MLVASLAVTPPLLADGATLVSDKGDYTPAEMAILTGDFKAPSHNEG
jgi:hypothetical protein